MTFQERFRDKISTITKEGIIGAIRAPGIPIDKHSIPSSHGQPGTFRRPTRDRMQQFTNNATKILSGIAAESTNSSLARYDKDISMTEPSKRVPLYDSPLRSDKQQPSTRGRRAEPPGFYGMPANRHVGQASFEPAQYPQMGSIFESPSGAQSTRLPQIPRSEQTLGGGKQMIHQSLGPQYFSNSQPHYETIAGEHASQMKSPILVKEHRYQNIIPKPVEQSPERITRRPRHILGRIPSASGEKCGRESSQISNSLFTEEDTSDIRDNISSSNTGHMSTSRRIVHYKPHSVSEYQDFVKQNFYRYGGLGGGVPTQQTKEIRTRINRLRGYSDRIADANADQYLNQLKKESKMMHNVRAQILQSAVLVPSGYRHTLDEHTRSPSPGESRYNHMSQEVNHERMGSGHMVATANY